MWCSGDICTDLNGFQRQKQRSRGLTKAVSVGRPSLNRGEGLTRGLSRVRDRSVLLSRQFGKAVSSALGLGSVPGTGSVCERSVVDGVVLR